MTNRKALQPQLQQCVASLVAVLGKSGDNSELVALRARRLLQWKSPGTSAQEWLGTVLPAPWQITKALGALNAATGSGLNPTEVAATDASNGQSQSPQQRGGRRRRR